MRQLIDCVEVYLDGSIPCSAWVALADFEEFCDEMEWREHYVTLVGPVYKGCRDCKRVPDECKCNAISGVRYEPTKRITGPELRQVSLHEMLTRLLDNGRN